MKELLKRLLRRNGNAELAQESEPVDVDPPLKPAKAKNSAASETSRKSGETLCPNTKCGKAISNPLKLTDLSQDQDGIYLACPYCFSRLDLAAVKQKSLAKRGPIKKSVSPGKVDPEETKGGGKCDHYLGYLRERPKDAPIPNECLTCPDAVECLLG